MTSYLNEKLAASVQKTEIKVRIASSGTLRRVALVRTDVSEELSASIIRVTRIGELRTLMMEALSSSETSVLTRVTLRNTPEDAILHSHRCENLKSFMRLTAVRIRRFDYATKLVLKIRRAVATDQSV
jgi:hypothetical protein